MSNRLCPKCGGDCVRVADSRQSVDGKATCRRRCCKRCGVRWSTYEISAREYQQIMPLLGKIADIARLRSKMREMLDTTEGILVALSKPKRIRRSRRILKSVSQV